MKLVDTPQGLYVDITETDIQSIMDQAQRGIRNNEAPYYEYFPQSQQTSRAVYIRLDTQ